MAQPVGARSKGLRRTGQRVASTRQPMSSRCGICSRRRPSRRRPGARFQSDRARPPISAHRRADSHPRRSWKRPRRARAKYDVHLPDPDEIQMEHDCPRLLQLGPIGWRRSHRRDSLIRWPCAIRSDSQIPELWLPVPRGVDSSLLPPCDSSRRSRRATGPN